MAQPLQIVTKEYIDEPDAQYSKEQMAVISNTIAPGLTKEEMLIFLHNCVRTRLDPLAKQIYAIKRGGRMCIQTAIDGFRLLAERTGRYSPGRDTQFSYDEKGFLTGAKVFVKKQTKDGTWHEISATAMMNEYNSTKGLWCKMPHVMLEKCAESRALRRAFPADLSGLYTEEEMGQSEVTAPLPETSKIPSQTVEILEQWLDGHEGLKEKVQKICGVRHIEDIKEYQMEAVREFSKNYLEKIKNDSDKAKESDLAEELDHRQPSHNVE